MGNRHEPTRRKLNPSGVILLLVGIVFAFVALNKIDAGELSPVALIPSVVVATLGVTKLTEIEVI